MTLNRLLLAASLAFSLPALAASGDADVGRKKSAPCAVCHGPNGVSASPDFPNLAGQYSDYLQTALVHYKNGKRKNPIMQAQVANLTPKDILDLSAYYASQKGLQVRY
ncbi:MAG TPA: cytochrome c [Usitatibacter sp.]|nr:cytochrome c [Usitatibacter sp.]